ncbi:unnamed protein product [Darwinula stevensoni]|uniref:(S)-2-hydroxy-acid oxidase n=1 Tax=Darwinula stevensoni TaxID=69355 RepID=A0A7R9FQD2_9CRUS|nr:unnamed protein product [Darwinula stevensoni]CAG0898964.1 unnamed protein product [Darwinula stevensoni]
MPIYIADLEERARDILPRSAWMFLKNGAYPEMTLRDNRDAFQRYKLRPRCLRRDVTARDLTATVLGRQVSLPFGIAPTGINKLIHPDGEIATAKAAETMGALYILSTSASIPMEDVATSSPNGMKWFQLYVMAAQDATEALIHRAENAGYRALVVTVDTPILGRREIELRQQFFLPDDIRMCHFEKPDASGERNLNTSVAAFNQGLTWQDLKWMKKVTKLPLILKGIMTAEDAQLAAESGIAAIIVSNHGARQLDGVPATIDVLPEIVRAVDGRCEIYFDGGITHGSDIFKALALGAQMVFVGKGILYGLACGGQQGVEKALSILRDELSNTMALMGCSSIKHIEKDMVIHQSLLPKL